MTKTSRTRKAQAAAEPADAVAAATPSAPSRPRGKLGRLIELLAAPQGASLEAMMAATGWQAHSVRGAMSGGLKKKHGLAIISEKTEAGRIYRISTEPAA